MCDCSDKGCHAHEGTPNCDHPATVTLYRIDMTPDLTGTDFCEDCAADALESGLFTDEPEEEAESRPCPVCDGAGIPMGFMGKREYYRCQQCGMEFSHEVTG